MQRLFEYITHHSLLSGAALAAGIAVLVYEIRERTLAFSAISAAQAVQYMNQGALVLDVRDKESFDAGHLADARSTPAATLEDQIDALKRWREKNIVVYCDRGVSGAAAARTLAKMGFAKVVNLAGGLDAWRKDNLPVVKTSGQARIGAK
jgi:rhodanese-related sulfurtransferase